MINEKLKQVQAENQQLKEENEKLMKITGMQNDKLNLQLKQVQEEKQKMNLPPKIKKVGQVQVMTIHKIE